MQSVKELSRHPAPASRPQPLAFLEGTLWIGSWDTDSIYGVNPKTWTVTHEVAAPGKPYGLAAFNGELRAVISIGAEDDRFFYRFVPGKGFDAESKTACPDFTGSHLAAQDGLLYLAQMGNRRMLVLDENYTVKREVAFPSRIAGFGFANGACNVISGDDELENLHFATLDLSQDTAQIAELATIPLDVRCLAFDGSAWWTSHREANEIVSFTR